MTFKEIDESIAAYQFLLDALEDQGDGKLMLRVYKEYVRFLEERLYETTEELCLL